jgi:hypothetical protein
MATEDMTFIDRNEATLFQQATFSFRHQYDRLTKKPNLSAKQLKRATDQFYSAGKHVLGTDPKTAAAMLATMRDNELAEPYQSRVARHLGILRQNAGME